jgi:ferredoxin
MIFYFSGTGNSRWAAEELAAGLGDEARSLVSLGGYRAQPQETVGLVFPVYAWGVPEHVLAFAKAIQPAGGYQFAVCTCGGEAGRTMEQLDKVFHLDGAWSLTMPSNYVPQGVDDAETIRSKLQAACEKLPQICEAVLSGETVRDVRRGSGSAFKSGLIHHAFNRLSRGTAPFAVHGSCTGCGRCAEICHMGLVQMREIEDPESGEKKTQPVWQYARCSLCLACINVCPEKAIVFGDPRKDDGGRYWFERDAAPLLKKMR